MTTVLSVNKDGPSKFISLRRQPMLPDNQDLLERTATPFLHWVQTGPVAPVQRSAHGEQVTLVVDDIHLASALDPQGEARRLVDACIPEGSAQAWVYGVCPQLVAAALRRAGRVSVVGLSQRAASAYLQSASLAGLDADRLRFFAPNECPHPQHPLVVASAELRLAEPSAIRDALVLDLARDAQSQHLETTLAGRTERGMANRAQYPKDISVHKLFGQGRSKAAVLAGGPSLAAGLKAVMPQRAEFTLIAVSTALRPLEAMGIVPDMVVLIDPAPEMTRHITELAHPERLVLVPLVYAMGVVPEVMAVWPGPRHPALMSTSGYDALREAMDIGTLFASGTVMHTAVDLAVQMGAQDVVLCGVDLAYPSDQTHADGAIFNRSTTGQTLTVESVTGGPVKTAVNFIGYLRDLESYISRTSGVRFWNASPNGAKIDGAPGYRP